MNIEIRNASKFLNKNIEKLVNEREEINFNEIALAVDSFASMKSMTKNEFLEKIFVGTF